MTRERAPPIGRGFQFAGTKEWRVMYAVMDGEKIEAMRQN
jgi:hypothetical protein